MLRASSPKLVLCDTMANTDGSTMLSLAQNKGEYESSSFMDAEQDYKVITK